MMWIYPLLSASILSSKSSSFLSCLLDCSSSSIFIVSLIPINFFVVHILFSYYEVSVKGKIYLLMFFLILIPVLFSFLMESPLYFLILLETSVLPTALAILSLSKDKDKLSSVFIMLSINLMGSVPFLIYSVWSVCFLQESLPISLTSANSMFMFLGFLLILSSKLPVAMFHFWLTKAHVAASACISMFLASVLLKLGSFGLMKFSHSFSYISSSFMKFSAPWCLLFSSIFALIMIRFADMKMLVALSSILHMSLMIPLICLGESTGVLSMLIMMVGHGLVSYFFFLVVSIIYEKSLSRSTHYNKGSESSNGSFYFIIFSLAFLNMGVPPLINFLSEMMACSSLTLYSLTSVLVFSFSMILSIFFCMFLLSKSSFSRKSNYSSQELEVSMSPSFWAFVAILCFFPLMY